MELVVDGASVSLSGARSYSAVRVVNGGILTHDPVGADGGLELSVSGEVFVDSSSAIDVSGKGFAPGRTLGGTTTAAATGRSGGSHGGFGFAVEGSTNPVYGDFRDPSDPGSGAAVDRDNGGAGGGVIRIRAATLRLDGAIRADGADGIAPYPNGGGGGSGGSIAIDVGTLRGTGSISANGGKGNVHCYYGCRAGGGGGGGRIAVRYAANDGFDLARITADGGDNATYDAGPGAPGTIFLQARNQPSVLYVRGSVSEPGAWTPLGTADDDVVEVDRLTISGAGVVAAPEHDMPVVAGEVALRDGAVLTHRPAVPGQWFALRLLVNGHVSIDASSAIDVTARGYGPGRGAHNRWLGAAGDLGGGSYGGSGGYASNFPYGDGANPDQPGSGGAAGAGAGGAGGGLVRISAATIQIDGKIRADGGPGRNEERNQPAGSGGGVLLNAGAVSGSGSISANGGRNGIVCYYGCRLGGSGGGGRVAIYGTNTLSMEKTSAAGGDGEVPGRAGTVEQPDAPRFVWSLPTDAVLHGTESLLWEGLGVDRDATLVEIAAIGTQTRVLATDRASAGLIRWDTTNVPDGRYELRATFLDRAGNKLGSASRVVLVANTLFVHGGRLAVDETWTAGGVHLVDRPILVDTGRTLTIEPGAIVKFAPFAGIDLADGAVLNATGTPLAPIVLTSLADDAHGGDTNRDGEASAARAGDWDGLWKTGSAQWNVGEHVSILYARVAHSGRITASETWGSEAIHEVLDSVVLAGGARVTIEPGTRVELGFARGIALEANARLDARGTPQKPIVFTSLRDGSGESTPQPGDWLWIDVGAGRADLDHARIRYGGGTASGEWEKTGVLRTFASTAVLNLQNSFVENAYFDGVLAWGGTATLENVVLRGIDRAVSAHPGGVVRVTNCTIDDNRIGLLVHGGEMSVANTLVTNSYESGLQYDFGAQPVVRYSNIWSPAPAAVNYRNTSDRTGTDGNVSVNPRYRDRARGNHRPGHLSPVIDAADGALAPPTDLAGATRYDDPRTPNTGTRTASGAFADIGAFEFVETADSDVDLVVVDVRGPAQATVGGSVTIEWTVRNAGVGPASGPWRDTIYLVTTLGGETVETEVADVDVGAGAPLGPGESRTFRAEVVVPGALVGDQTWQVRTNSRGDVFEGRNQDNNSGRASGSVNVEVPVLPLDSALEASLDANARAHWFVFFAPLGAEYDLELTADRDSPQTVLYARRTFVASAQEYDWRTAPGPGIRRRLHVPGGPEGYVYVLVSVASAPDPPLRFTLRRTASNAFELTSVGPTEVCNAGQATLGLHGSGFTPRTRAWLRRSGEEIAADDVFLADSATLYATFPVQGLAAGAYDVVLRDQRMDVGADGSATVADLAAERRAVLHLTAGQGGRLTASLSTRDVQRAGRPFDVLLTYRNEGCSDLRAPLLLVRAPGARLTIEEEPFAFVDAAQVMGFSQSGPPGRLRAGQQETARLVVTPPLTVESFAITVAPAADGAGGPDLDVLADYLHLPLDTDWGQTVRRGLHDLVGSSWASYEAALQQAAAAISYGRRPPTVAVLLQHMAAISTPPMAVTPAPEGPRVAAGAIVPTVHTPPPGHTRYDPWGTGPEFDYSSALINEYASKLEAIARLTVIWPPWVWGSVHLDHFLKGSGTKLSYGPNEPFTAELKEDPSFQQYLRSGDWRKDVRVAARALADPLECGQAVRMPLKVVIDLPETGGGAFPGWMDAPGGQAIGGVDKAELQIDLYVMRRENDIQVVGRGSVKFSDFYHWAGHVWYHKPDYDPPWNWWACYLEHWGAAKGFPIEVDFGEVLTVEETISGESVPFKKCDKVQFVPEPPEGFVLDETGVRLAGSVDPNDKAASGHGSRGWLRDDPLILYAIRFENKSAATAPAQEVVVTDQLSTDLDWSTFELEAIGFNDRLIEVPDGRQNYADLVTVGSDPNPVRVLAQFDPDTGLLVLRLRSEDPVTRGLPDDPFAGFLPPNDDAHRGEGFLRFTVKPRTGLADGTRIRNRARIVFDVNEPIDTNEIVNTIGFPPPVCAGDCGEDGEITIDELVKGVSIALGIAPLSNCSPFDRDSSGEVTIDELVAAVSNALMGCPATSS